VSLRDVIKKYLLSEESVIEVDENEINNAKEFLELDEIKVGTRVILVGKNGRKRLVDLGILQIIAKCGHVEFIKDYLDLSIPLSNIYEKYGVYTEIEYLALNEKCYTKDEDLIAVLKKLKEYILKRDKASTIRY